MTIRHLKIFIAVAELGSMSAAAQQLYLSQPTVSQAIKELEDHYGVLLFERYSRKLFITGHGEKLLVLAHQVVNQFDSLEDTLKKQGTTSFIRLGASITVGTCLLADIMNDLDHALPGAELFSYVSNTQDIEKKLLTAELDAAIVEGHINSPDLVCQPIIRDRLVLVCSQKHPFYSRDTIKAEELNHQKFAIREKGSGTRSLFEQYLFSHNIQIQVCWEANCPTTILNAIIRNHMLSVMSYRLMLNECLSGQIKLFRFDTDLWDRDFQLVYHKNKYLSPEIQELQKILQKYASKDITDHIQTSLILSE